MTETIKLPKKVIDSDWKDDIDDNDYKLYPEEKKYISPRKISKIGIKKIKTFKLNRGALNIFKKDEKLAA